MNFRQIINDDLEVIITERTKDFELLINGKSFRDYIKKILFCEDLDLNYFPISNETFKTDRRQIVKNLYA